jgi:hypothetical protein
MNSTLRTRGPWTIALRLDASDANKLRSVIEARRKRCPPGATVEATQVIREAIRDMAKQEGV